MHDQPSLGRASGRIPWGLLGMLVLVIAVEKGYGRFAVHFATGASEDWRLTAQAARREAVGCQVLTFGDSLVKFSVVPPVVEERTGRKTYGLALYQGMGPSSYFLLRSALEAGARPEAIVIDGEGLPVDPLQPFRGWAELCRFRDILDLAREARRMSLVGQWLVARTFATAKDREEIRWILGKRIQGQFASYGVATLWRNRRMLRGGTMWGPVKRVDLDQVEQVYFPRGWTPHPLNQTYIGKFLELASRQEIPVYWLIAPTTPLVEARRDQGGQNAACDRFLDRCLARFPNLTVVDGRRSGYGIELFHDPTHLAREGALTLSADLADILRRGPHPSQRRVALPTYRKIPGLGDDLEDLSRSSLALQEMTRR